MKYTKFYLLAAVIIFGLNTYGQEEQEVSIEEEVVDTNDYSQWHHGDITADTVAGISLDQAYEFAKEKKKIASVVIVAIIDSGVDTAHEDIKDNLWINPKEIPYNNIDDDGNGYVDDIHGWNFIGNIDGQNVDGDTWEVTRLYKKYKSKYDGKTKKDIASEDKQEYEEWLQVKEEFESKRKSAKDQLKQLNQIVDAINSSNEILSNQLGANFTKEDVENLRSSSDRINWAKKMYGYFEGDVTGVEGARDYQQALVSKKLNTRYDPRHIVGDDVFDITDTIYGNNDVTAETSGHGTGVAGIVGAVRDNDIGVQGIVDSVRIMAIRVVPGGDERDKDVALGIRYAVNNGAKIINCSFGKLYSPNQEFVDSAVRYAEDHGVLIIHASGNDGANNDEVVHFPTPEYAPSQYVSNWIDVGASSKDLGFNLPASFSNYGNTTVDIFAPGVDIRSTAPKSKYNVTSGTSDASPVVTGVAALVLSFYPHLTAVQLKEIILDSSRKYPKLKVLLPGTEKKKTKFMKLSTTAGVVNAYEALKLAEERYGNQ